MRVAHDVSSAETPNRIESGEEELLDRLYAGDVGALEGVYALHSGYVMGIALRVLRDPPEAEEVVQDVFWQLWKGRVRYDARRGQLRTWLFVIARNRALDRLRRRRPPEGDDPEVALGRVAASDDPELDARSRERYRRVQAALGSLGKEQRQAIELAFYGGFSHSEIASQTGAPLGTVKSRIKRGMARLRIALDHEEVLL